MNLKEQILEIATERFMHYGIRSVSMDDLSSQLGISKKTLYRFVENKQDLVNLTISRHIELEKELMLELGRTATDAIDEMVHIARHITHIFKELRPTLIYDLQKYYKSSWRKVVSLHSEYISSIIKKNISRGIDEGFYRRDIRPEIISRLYVAKSWAVIDEKVFPQAEFKGDELVEQLILYHLHGIMTPKGLDHLSNFQIFK